MVSGNQRQFPPLATGLSLNVSGQTRQKLQLFAYAESNWQLDSQTLVVDSVILTAANASQQPGSELS